MPLVQKPFGDVITFTRASTATFFDSAGVLQSAAIDVPRFDYDPATLAARGFLIEEARTNSIRNNTMVGAVAGTPGTLPQVSGSPSWGFSIITTTGLTTSVDSVGTENGISYIDLKISGTASGAGILLVSFENANVITASSGQTWAGSLYWKIAAGTLNGLSSFQYRVDERSTGFLAAVTLITGQTPTTAALATQRIFGSGTLANASTTNIQPYIRATIADGAAIDFTLRIGLPQLELGAFATSVIPTTTTALTRSADVASVNTLSPWFNASEGTLVGEFVWEGLKSIAGQRIAGFDDGTTTNYWMMLATSSNTMNGFVVVGGSTEAINSTPTTTYSANTLYKQALALALNNSASAVDGIAGTTDTSVTVPTVNTLRFGASSASTTSNLWLRRITYYPRRLSNAELQGITA